MTKKIKQELQDEKIKTDEVKTRKSIQKKTIKFEGQKENIKAEY